MSLRLFILVLTLTSAAVYISVDSSTVGQTYPIAFMNITPDVQEQGYIQIYAVAQSDMTIRLSSYTGIVANKADNERRQLIDFYNVTKAFHETAVVEDAEIGKERVDRNAILLSSDSALHAYGVVVDKGTTDGFMSLPLTLQSTEFFIAAWNCTDSFFAGALVVSAYADTCVEVWKVNGDSYSLRTSQYLAVSHLVHTFTANLHEDLTGFFINSSKPIAVYAGHSCAFVPEDVFFCDHMVEQIPPVFELDSLYVVPPIAGRNPDAGYFVRVVSTDMSTSVTWETANGQTTGSQLVSRGQFVQIYNPLASDAMRVTCDKPCLCMQYNPSRNMIGLLVDVPTDPFMMLVASYDHCDNHSGFATANFFVEDSRRSELVEFSNYVAVVTKTSDVGEILLDGQLLAKQSLWSTVPSWGFSYVTVAVSHGPHVISVADRSSACFLAYSYGHSNFPASTSAYGYTIVFRMKGELDTRIWQQGSRNASAPTSVTCAKEEIYSGSAVANYSTSTEPRLLKFTILLNATVNSPPMTTECQERYRLALVSDLRNLSRTVNYRICTGVMCPYITGAPGSGVPVDRSADPHVVFVAIDTAALTNLISFNVVASTGAITGVNVQVPYTGIMDTTAATFAKCRVEVRDFMRNYINWPRGNQLLNDLTSDGCPPITVYAPYHFVVRQTACAFS